MISTYASIEPLIQTMIANYQDLAGEDPEFLLMDEDSYEILKEELLGKMARKMELTWYRGMKVFHSDNRELYIRVV